MFSFTIIDRKVISINEYVMKKGFVVKNLCSDVQFFFHSCNLLSFYFFSFYFFGPNFNIWFVHRTSKRVKDLHFLAESRSSRSSIVFTFC